MSFSFNAKGIKMDEAAVAPEGVYTLQIKKASDFDKEGNPRITKNGDPYVSVKCEIDDTGEWLGTTVFHNVTFLPKEKKGAGMALQFLKAIGEPYEGVFDVEPDNWIGKRFRAKLKVTKDLNGRPKNEIAYLIVDQINSETRPVSDEEVPF